MEPLKIHLPVDPLISVCLSRGNRGDERPRRRQPVLPDWCLYDAHLGIQSGFLCALFLLCVLAGESALALPSERHLWHLVAVGEALRRGVAGGRRGAAGRAVCFPRGCHRRAALQKMGLHQFGESRRHLAVVHAAAIWKRDTQSFRVVLDLSALESDWMLSN